MLNLLSKLLALGLIIVTLGLVASVIIGQTLLNSEYMKSQLKEADAYSRLSTQLSSQVASSVGVDNPQVNAAVQQVITPEAIQQKVDPAISQLQTYYRGEGPPPRIEMGDLVAQAQAAGIPIQPDPELSKPIVLSANQDEKPLTNKFANVGLVTILLAVVILGSLVFLSWKTKSYGTLPVVLIVCGVLFGFLSLFLLFSQGVFEHFVKFDFNSNAYSGIAHDLTKNISHDMGIRYGILAGIFLVVGVATLILVKRLKTPSK